MARLLVPAVLGGLVLAQARLFREATCETFDEAVYVMGGIRLYRRVVSGRVSSCAARPCGRSP